MKKERIENERMGRIECVCVCKPKLNGNVLCSCLKRSSYRNKSNDEDDFESTRIVIGVRESRVLTKAPANWMVAAATTEENNL